MTPSFSVIVIGVAVIALVIGLALGSIAFPVTETTTQLVTTQKTTTVTVSVTGQSNAYALSAFLGTAQSLYSHPPSSPTCSSPNLVNISSDNFLSLKAVNDSALSMDEINYQFVILNQSSGATSIGSFTISYGTNQSSTINYVGGYPVQFNVTSSDGTRVGSFVYYVVLPQISSYPVFVEMYRIGQVSFLLMNYDQNCTTSYRSMWIAFVA